MPFLTYDPFPQCLQQSPLTPLLLARVTSEEVGAIYQTLSVSMRLCQFRFLSIFANSGWISESSFIGRPSIVWRGCAIWLYFSAGLSVRHYGSAHRISGRLDRRCP